MYIQTIEGLWYKNPKFTGGPLYLCDPKKNICCTKETCYMYGGECHHTQNRNYRLFNRKEIKK